MEQSIRDSRPVLPLFRLFGGVLNKIVEYYADLITLPKPTLLQHMSKYFPISLFTPIFINKYYLKHMNTQKINGICF